MYVALLLFPWIPVEELPMPQCVVRQEYLRQFRPLMYEALARERHQAAVRAVQYLEYNRWRFPHCTGHYEAELERRRTERNLYWNLYLAWGEYPTDDCVRAAEVVRSILGEEDFRMGRLPPYRGWWEPTGGW